MPHLFVAPVTVQSPHWLQAFPDAHLVREFGYLNSSDLVWLLLTGAQSIAQIKNLADAGIKVVAMTAIEQTSEARQVLEAGASGYVHYLAVPSVLEQIAQSVALGGVWLGAELMRELILGAQRLAAPAGSSPKADLNRLTSRERAVAELVAAGKTNKEVARALDITERTVKAHLGASFEKLGVRDRLQLALALSG
ncbi:LuxR family transcriptional regulator [Cellvibrio fontiphilus]|jgi:DNA-binding NarL/FixJ family response regulator|uniref:LuxR C-terminal-related transcriptional regulator n=1 Tax=Cellvibrio fontiphilus TaxID=1815559 RepID=A0ABV7FFS4_9GAMM